MRKIPLPDDLTAGVLADVFKSLPAGTPVRGVRGLEFDGRAFVFTPSPASTATTSPKPRRRNARREGATR